MKFIEVFFWKIQDWIVLPFSWDEYQIVLPFLVAFIFLDFPRYTLLDIITNLISVLGRFKNQPNNNYYPKVSILVSAHNEEKIIDATIRSLLEADYPNKEIIVVDDGSTDRTYEYLYPYARKGLIRLFRNQNRQGKPAGMHICFQASKGEIIFVMDSDTTFDRDSIRKIVECFKDPKVGAVAGNLMPRNYDKNIITQLQACEYLQGISLGRVSLSIIGILFIVSGAFGAFRRDVIERTGGWDAPAMGEDSDMTIKTRKLGHYKVKFAPEAIAMTDVPETLMALIRQRIRWDRSFVRLRLRKHKSLWNPFQFGLKNFLGFAEDLFFTLLLPLGFFFYALSIVFLCPELIPMVVILTIIIYSTTNFLTLTLGILLSRWKERWPLIFYAPLLVPYRIFLRLLRMYAFSIEILHIFQRETYCPDKIWDVLFQDPVIREYL